MTVGSYSAKKHVLTATVKKRWCKATCAVEVGQTSEFRLWQPVQWTDPHESPAELSFHGAFDDRHFHAGQEIVLISSGGDYETFVDTPRLQQTLELALHPELIAARVQSLPKAELQSWLGDESLGSLFLAEALKQHKLDQADVLATERASSSSQLGIAADNYLATLSPEQRLSFFEALCTTLDLTKADALARVQTLLSEDRLPKHALRARLFLLDHLDVTQRAHAELASSLLMIYFPDDLVKHDPVVERTLRDQWAKLVAHAPRDARRYTIDLRDRIWLHLDASERARLTPMLAPGLAVPDEQCFYNSTLFDMLFADFAVHGQPAGFDLFRPQWSDRRFFEDHTSRPSSVVEGIAKRAGADATFVPLLREVYTTAKQHGVRFAWDVEPKIKQLVGVP